MTLCAYDGDLLNLVQDTLGKVFEICIDCENIPISEFSERFAGSRIAHCIEEDCWGYIMGISATQMAEELLGHELGSYMDTSYGASYWTGFVYAYVQ